MSIQYAPGNGATPAICEAAEEATIAIIETIKNTYMNYNKVHKK